MLIKSYALDPANASVVPACLTKTAEPKNPQLSKSTSHRNDSTSYMHP